MGGRPRTPVPTLHHKLFLRLSGGKATTDQMHPPRWHLLRDERVLAKTAQISALRCFGDTGRFLGFGHSTGPSFGFLSHECDETFLHSRRHRGCSKVANRIGGYRQSAGEFGAFDAGAKVFLDVVPLIVGQQAFGSIREDVESNMVVLPGHSIGHWSLTFVGLFVRWCPQAPRWLDTPWGTGRGDVGWTFIGVVLVPVIRPVLPCHGFREGARAGERAWPGRGSNDS